MAATPFPLRIRQLPMKLPAAHSKLAACHMPHATLLAAVFLVDVAVVILSIVVVAVVVVYR